MHLPRSSQLAPTPGALSQHSPAGRAVSAFRAPWARGAPAAGMPSAITAQLLRICHTCMPPYAPGMRRRPPGMTPAHATEPRKCAAPQAPGCAHSQSAAARSTTPMPCRRSCARARQAQQRANQTRPALQAGALGARHPPKLAMLGTSEVKLPRPDSRLAAVTTDSGLLLAAQRSYARRPSLRRPHVRRTRPHSKTTRGRRGPPCSVRLLTKPTPSCDSPLSAPGCGDCLHGREAQGLAPRGLLVRQRLSSTVAWRAAWTGPCFRRKQNGRDAGPANLDRFGSLAGTPGPGALWE